MCKQNNEQSSTLLDSMIFYCNCLGDHHADYMMDKTYHNSVLNHVSKSELQDILTIGEYNTVTGCHDTSTICDQRVLGPKHPGSIDQPSQQFVGLYGRHVTPRDSC